MSNASYPFAVRLVGFSSQETDIFTSTFSLDRDKGCRYFCLEEDNLQEPDLYIVNADDMRALLVLSNLPHSDVRPVLLLGAPDVDLPYPHVARPISWPELFGTLDGLIEKRADTLSRLEASDIVAVPERRRRERLDIDLTDPADYERMRNKILADSGVLVVDRNSAFRDYLAEMLERKNIAVSWAGDEAHAVELCKQQPIAVVMMNTATPGIEPYRSCRAIRQASCIATVKVVFLTGAPFVYDAVLAKDAGAEGFLTKPVASQHLISVLKKFFPDLSRPGKGLYQSSLIT